MRLDQLLPLAIVFLLMLNTAAIMSTATQGSVLEENMVLSTSSGNGNGTATVSKVTVLSLTYTTSGNVVGATTSQISDQLRDLQPITITVSALQSTFTMVPEASANTGTCMSNSPASAGVMTNNDYTLLFFTNHDNSMVGDGYIWKVAGQGEWVFDITFFNQEGWSIRIRSTQVDTGQQPLYPAASDYGVNSLQPSQQLNFFNPTVNTEGVSQYQYRMQRVLILYNDRGDNTDDDNICRILNQANTYFRAIGAYIYLEAIETIDPESAVGWDQEEGGENEGWSSPGDCGNVGNPDPLPNDIWQYAMNRFGDDGIDAGYSRGQGYFFEAVDSVFYLFIDDGTNHDGLDWSSARTNGRLGCTQNFYANGEDAGTMNSGHGWVRIQPDYPSTDDWVRWNSILLAHEIGHSLGAGHEDAVTSWQDGTGGSLDCGGDGTNDNSVDTVPDQETENEGQVHTIMRSGMPDDLDCWGAMPRFNDDTTLTDNARDAMLVDGAFFVDPTSRDTTGLEYDHIQPHWASAPERRSIDDWYIRYWFVQPHADSPDIGQGEDFWRAAYHLRLLSDAQPFELYEAFIGIRTTADLTYVRDAWLGYSGGRTSAQLCTPVYDEFFEAGESRDFWTEGVQPTLTGFNNLDDDHQYSNMNSISSSGTWILWPAYHDRPQDDWSSYGPYAWVALTWSQTD